MMHARAREVARLHPGIRRACRTLALLALVAGCATAPVEEPLAPDPVVLPEGIAPLVERAEAAEAAGDLDGAIEGWADALEQTPWNTRIAQRLAVSYLGRASFRRAGGSLKGAEADLRAAYEITPDDPRVKRSLAMVLAERGERSLDRETATDLRNEAISLDPDLEIDFEQDARLERRLDLAFELLDRGQLDAGIQRLTSLRGEYPDSLPIARLLGQARVQRAGELADRRNFDGAGTQLDLAVAAYRPFGLCGESSTDVCTPDEIRTAHHNRIVVWVRALEGARARKALADAEALGLDFPDLRERVDPAR